MVLSLDWVIELIIKHKFKRKKSEQKSITFDTQIKFKSNTGSVIYNILSIIDLEWL